ncbi:MAG: 50S ribosomal protein L15, partial [Acutalibacteraceae bacterium]|nr:50S ribosomal protein L15 [Acutalibacteraceae bacterium]
GQKARAGHGMRPGFEGGQMPLQRRVPKRGFNNIFAEEYAIINVAALEMFDDGAVVDVAALESKGIVKDASMPVKVLGNGKLSKKVTVKGLDFSETAKQKIEAAGGTVEVK